MKINPSFCLTQIFTNKIFERDHFFYQELLFYSSYRFNNYILVFHNRKHSILCCFLNREPRMSLMISQITVPLSRKRKMSPPTPAPTAPSKTRAASSNAEIGPAGSGSATKREKVDSPPTSSFTLSKANTMKSPPTPKESLVISPSNALSAAIPMSSSLVSFR